MLINKHCTVCHDDIGPGESVTCEICEKSIHEACVDYEQTFDCPDCGDELDIGAVEF